MSSRVLRICALSESDSAASWRFCESKHAFLSCGHCINDNDLLTYVVVQMDNCEGICYCNIFVIFVTIIIVFPRVTNMANSIQLIYSRLGKPYTGT